MQTVIVSHEHHPEAGWAFHADEPLMIGGYQPDFAASCREAESVAFFALTGEAEDRGDAPPRVQDVRFEHVLDRQSAAA